MFMTCYNVVIDPEDFAPVVEIYTTSRWATKSMIRHHIGKCKISKSVSTTFFGIPMWQLYVKFDTMEQIEKARRMWPRKVVRTDP